MIPLLKDMFQRGNRIDIAWFLGGAWLLIFFFATLGYQIFRKVTGRSKTKDSKAKPTQPNS